MKIKLCIWKFAASRCSMFIVKGKGFAVSKGEQRKDEFGQTLSDYGLPKIAK